jgi:hypothetical protein
MPEGDCREDDKVIEAGDLPDGYRVAAHLGVGRPEGPLPAMLSRRRGEEFSTADYFDGHAFSGYPPHPPRESRK